MQATTRLAPGHCDCHECGFWYFDSLCYIKCDLLLHREWFHLSSSCRVKSPEKPTSRNPDPQLLVTNGAGTLGRVTKFSEIGIEIFVLHTHQADREKARSGGHLGKTRFFVRAWECRGVKKLVCLYAESEWKLKLGNLKFFRRVQGAENLYAS